ncbi:MAG: hypothetical protein LBO69_08325 [Ignavibacteria bacterium]|jgi:hypothetical protein|nr:hypothetical protein [Ignavibacteria bacterium]
MINRYRQRSELLLEVQRWADMIIGDTDLQEPRAPEVLAAMIDVWWKIQEQFIDDEEVWKDI